MVDVIIPAYNAMQTLERAVTSALMQGNCRVLLIDDGSTDGTARLCDEYQHHPLISVLHQPNRGVSAARNAGLRAATAEWVLFLDADDVLLPDAVAKLLELVGSAQAIQGIVTRTEAPDVPACTVETLPARTMLERALWQPTVHLHTHGWLLRRTICNQWFNETLRLGEDGEWMMRVLRGAETAALARVNTYCYHVRADSAVHGGADVQAYLRTLTAAQETLDALAMPAAAAAYRLTHLLLMLTHGVVRRGNLREAARQCAAIRRLCRGEFRADLRRVRGLPRTPAQAVWLLMRLRCYPLVRRAVRVRQGQGLRACRRATERTDEK